MTEIPEHLLKRAKERRDALGGSEVGATSGAPAAAPSQQAIVPAPVAQAIVPVVPGAPDNPLPPPPDPAYVAAAKSRKKIPFWAMATLSLLPLWAFVYMLALRPQEKIVLGGLCLVMRP